MRSITILFALWALLYGTKTANICTKQRCDFLKALLPFCILLHHHAQRTVWPWPFDGDFCVLGAPVVMMFFFISGYGLEFKRATKGLQLSDLPMRLKRLFTPTFLPILMYTIALFMTNADILVTLNEHIHSCFYPLPFSWFVVVLAMLYIVFYVSSYLARNTRSFLVALFISSVAVIAILKILKASPWMTGSNLALFVGALYRNCESMIINILKKYKLRIVVTLLSVCFVLVYFHLNWLKGRGCLWLLLIFVTFSFVKIFSYKTIDFLTKISYDVYLCQGIAFVLIPYKEWNFAVSFAAIVLLTVIIATFSHWAHGKIFKR